MYVLANRALQILFVGGVILLAVLAAAQDNLLDAPIPHSDGQSVSASFEGWYPNPDGTYSLVFGYFNRNYDEHLQLPVGADNRFELTSGLLHQSIESSSIACFRLGDETLGLISFLHGRLHFAL